MNLPPYKLVKNPSTWQDCLHKLQQEPRLAIDLEANSLYAYQERVCLIQISIPGQDFIVDPVANIQLEPLGEILADPAVEKVFHAAEYDLILLKQEYGWQLVNLFDTMWAARILGQNSMGLANILKELYGVKLNKRYQKANWCKRPLTKAELSYAQADTHFLLRLRDHMQAQLAAGGYMEEAQEIFAEQTQVQASSSKFDPNDFWSINGCRKLTKGQQAILKALAIYRDGIARKRNRPHFKILGNQTLLELAAQAPDNLDRLSNIYGMSSGQIRRYGRQLLKVIRKAQDDPPPKRPPRPPRPPEEVSKRYEHLHLWRKQRAQKRGVESDVIVSRDLLWELARANPQTEADLDEIKNLGPWRRKTYGREILQTLQRS